MFNKWFKLIKNEPGLVNDDIRKSQNFEQLAGPLVFVDAVGGRAGR